MSARCMVNVFHPSLYKKKKITYKAYTVLDVWLPFSIQIYMTQITYKVYTLQLKGSSNLVELPL